MRASVVGFAISLLAAACAGPGAKPAPVTAAEPVPSTAAAAAPSAATPAEPSSSASAVPQSLRVDPPGHRPGEASAKPAEKPPETRSKSEREDDYLERLHHAGDKHRCREEMAKIRKEWAEDADFSDDDLERIYRSRDIHPDRPMPYPTPGTACAIFGVQQVLHGAINDRMRARGEKPKYPEDDRPLVVGGE